MQKYIGTKVIKAKPMNRAEYNQLRGWQLPADEDGADLGYLVEYEPIETIQGNVAGYTGYISWSPKSVFEASYKQPLNVVTEQQVDDAILMINTSQFNASTAITEVVMTHGFTIIETSACVDPRNFDLQIGEAINLKKIKDKIWFLLGYELTTKLRKMADSLLLD